VDQLAKIVEPVFECRNAYELAAMVGGPHHIQQEPETGNQRDGRKRQNCKLMARQADQFNTAAKPDGTRSESPDTTSQTIIKKFFEN
jgi:hypothetical protein